METFFGRLTKSVKNLVQNLHVSNKNKYQGFEGAESPHIHTILCVL